MYNLTQYEGWQCEGIEHEIGELRVTSTFVWGVWGREYRTIELMWYGHSWEEQYSLDEYWDWD